MIYSFITTSSKRRWKKTQTNLLIAYVIKFLIQVYWQMAEKRRKDRDAREMEDVVTKYKIIWILCDLGPFVT